MIKLGVMGLSEGNGHPYSWSAIFNGYDPNFMKECPFPVIPQYLSQQSFPEDSILEASVTHIWTQDKKISEQVAKASLIPHCVDNYEELVDCVDAILLARDDAENHFEMAKPFLDAGIPIFIDKPLALTVAEAKELLALQQYEGQLYSCSSLRYAKAFQLTDDLLDQIGKVHFIEGFVPKAWNTYAIHIIEPSIAMGLAQGQIEQIIPLRSQQMQSARVKWSCGLEAQYNVMGTIKCPLEISLYGDKGFTTLTFKDTFFAFKKSLKRFIHSIQEKKEMITRKETLNCIQIVEGGNA